MGKLVRNVLRFSFEFIFTCKGSFLNEKSKILKVFSSLGKKRLKVRVSYFVSGTIIIIKTEMKFNVNDRQSRAFSHTNFCSFK